VQPEDLTKVEKTTPSDIENNFINPFDILISEPISVLDDYNRFQKKKRKKKRRYGRQD
jgi:hypothetical protein